MKLSELIEGIEPVEIIDADEELEIIGISDNSKAVRKGFLFVAKRGLKADGHLYISEAIENGAVCVVFDRPAEFPKAVARIRVADSQSALARLASTFYRNPAEKLRVIGVTGTNGKTTITLLTASILAISGKKPLVIGTLGVGKQIEEAGRFSFSERGLTSPEPIKLHGILRSALDEGCDTIVMEASSHAIAQRRLDHIPFKVRIFTNLTPEHLDFHLTMENYFQAKRSFFERREFGDAEYAVICTDNDEGRTIFESVPYPAISYGFSQDASVRGKITEMTLSGSVFEAFTKKDKAKKPEAFTRFQETSYRILTSLIGKYNILNALCALAVGLAEGVSEEAIAKAISSVKVIPGRLERVENDKGIYVFVDYAHTPHALREVLGSLRELCPASRLICVFGCGGDRDRTKRPLMARAVAEFANAIVITNDNPRSEDPVEIANEIVDGLRGVTFPHSPKYTVELDRRLAISLAIHDANPGDVVLIAGKGHEDYQIFADRTIHFSDVEVAKKILEEG